MSHRTIIEPFKIKITEPLALKTRAEREKILKAAHYNLFLIKAEDVTFDFLTDSGTTAMSAAQWAAMMIADESYAGSRSFFKFKEVVQDITGYEHVIPTHQGRAAERLLFSMVIKPGMKVPSNNHFDTTRANIEAMGAQAVDLVIPEGKVPSLEHPFKGNIDLARLEDFCREHQDKIPLGMLTITNNTGGGQPVALENIRGAAEIYRKYKIPFILDACRFAENAYFIKSRDVTQGDRPIPDIVRDVFDLADGCLMSAKKDGLVNIGGFIALRSAEWVQDLRNQLILTEGFPTYGGLAARDLEALAVGLREVLSEDYLRYRIATSAYMGRRLHEMGVPTVRPAGGHAVYIDAAKFLPHIPSEQFPGQSLACELYLQDGIRSCEIGSVMFKQAATMELVRLAFPRRVYTQSHFDYILEGFEELLQRRNELRGYRIKEAPPFLRHFTAKFEAL
jgi:tyrosine phenol-lyase